MIQLPTDDNPALIIQGDALQSLRQLPDQSINCVVTSPPYWGLRDYGTEGQIGLEPTPESYVAAMVGVFEEVRRVLRNDGTLWLNLGDTYAGGGRGGNPNESAFRKQATNQGSLIAPTPIPSGYKPKDLIGIPWRVAFALQSAGWYLRSDIIWHKPNPMPESVTDRPTKSHEYLFLLSKSERYYFDGGSVREPMSAASKSRYEYSFGGDKNNQLLKDGLRTRVVGTREETDGRNIRTVWSINTTSYPEAHFATFPPALVKPCILAGCPKGGIVVDPFAGSGTTLAVAIKLGRRAIGIELNPEYVKLIEKRLSEPLDIGGLFGAESIPIKPAMAELFGA